MSKQSEDDVTISATVYIDMDLLREEGSAESLERFLERAIVKKFEERGLIRLTPHGWVPVLEWE